MSGVVQTRSPMLSRRITRNLGRAPEPLDCALNLVSLKLPGELLEFRPPTTKARAPTFSLRKLLYRAGLLTPYWQIDRTRYLKRLSKRRGSDDWRYVARDDVTQFTGSEVVARLAGVSARVFFYCDRSSSSIEAEILKSSKSESGTPMHRLRVLELGFDLISPGSRVIDIGANIGIYALPWAAANTGATVHCFEPNPGVRARLARNVALNRLESRVRLHSEALSDRAGTATLYGSDDMSSLNQGVNTGRQAVPIEVRLARLDEVLHGEGPPVSLIKIDVQGHELEVLRGAEAVVSRHRPALILEHEDDLYRSAADASPRKDDMGGMLERLGWRRLS